MNYKKLAAAGMSAALVLSIGGSALAKAPSSPPSERQGAVISASRSDDGGSRHGGAPQEGTSIKRSDTDRVPESRQPKTAADAPGTQSSEKPSQKPDRKPDAKTDSSQSAEKTEKKSETKPESGKGGQSGQTSETNTAKGKKSEKPDESKRGKTQKTNQKQID